MSTSRYIMMLLTGWWNLRLTVKILAFFTANGLFFSVMVNRNLKNISVVLKTLKIELH